MNVTITEIMAKRDELFSKGYACVILGVGKFNADITNIPRCKDLAQSPPALAMKHAGEELVVAEHDSDGFRIITFISTKSEAAQVLFRDFLSAAKAAPILVQGYSGAWEQLNQSCRNGIAEIMEKLPLDQKSREQVSKLRGSACFIATACYGNCEHPAVLEFRWFRDYILQTNVLGRLFVKVYYLTSPPLASYLHARPVRAFLIREYVLHPILRIIATFNHRKDR